MQSRSSESPAPLKEILAWAMFDFANSSYTTVVSTAIFNPYFVQTLAGSAAGNTAGKATLLLTIAIAVSNALIVATAPIVGAIADHAAIKKKLLWITTYACVLFTICLGFIPAGQVAAAMIMLTFANVMYGTGEDLIAAFLPELSTKERMGRISAIGWTLGYIGGLSCLGLCLAYVHWAKDHGLTDVQYVPVTLWICATVFGLAALPTFLLLKERALPSATGSGLSVIKEGLDRLWHTLRHVARYQDLFRFLLCLLLYTCGIATIVTLAAVYAQQVMHFKPSQVMLMVLLVNITASVGAFAFGFLQDHLGSVRTLMITLVIWLAAIVLAITTESQAVFWLVANLIGLAMGASQSIARALIGQFSPAGRSAEFFGLWGLAVKLAAIIGPLSFGVITDLSGSNFRLALLSTGGFFLAGLLTLFTVSERRGKAAAARHD